MKLLFSLLTFGCLILNPPRLAALDWQYRLLDGSTLLDDCLICARPTIQQPVRGTFRLVPISDIPPFAHYELRYVSFVAGSPANGSYSILGGGTYQIGGAVALLQDLTLEVRLSDPNQVTANKVFTNEVRTIDHAWPIIDIRLVQTDGDLIHYYSLRLIAAPMREIWFSTAGGFTAATWQNPTNHISAGDVISDSGRIVRSNARLLGPLGLISGLSDQGIDAMDILPGGEVLFSLNEAVFSETLGQIRQGDLLSDRGKIFRSNEELTSAFALPAATDYGLDAVQVLTNGVIYFSITTNVVAPNTGML